jgi:hypothetical protein
MSKIRIGQKVKFRIGRGFSMGTVTALAGDKALLLTRGGKEITRRIEALSVPKTGAEEDE